MKPIKPKYTNLIKTEFNISDKSREILKRYAEYTKFSESEIIDQMISEIINDDPKFVKYLSNKRYDKKIQKVIFQNDDRSISQTKDVTKHAQAN
jgi:hypothetical protein